MRKSLLCLAVLTSSLLLPHSASAYRMATQTYSNMFERADVVVIATPIATQDSEVELKLKVDQSKQVTDLIMTVDTEFKVAYTLKGKLDANTFHFLHLNRKDKKPFAGRFGSVGTFFVDFETKENKRKSFILFITKRKDGTYCPAWRPMEGSRAIIPVTKDGDL